MVKISLVAAPAVMVKALALTGGVRTGLEVAARVYPMPALVMEHPVKPATPETALTVRPPALVQARTPADGLVPMAKVTALVAVLTVLALASWTLTETGKVPVPLAWMF